MICDPEVLCQIGIAKFDHFADRISYVHKDTLLGRSLLFMSEGRWRAMRKALTPAFTGIKMRKMFDLILDVVNESTLNLAQESKNGKSMRWEMEELFGRFMSDTLASCMFGLKLNSFENPSNDFITCAKTAFNCAAVKTGIRLYLINTFPRLMHALDVESVSHHANQLIKSIVLNVMDERKKKQIFRPDLINTLMELRTVQQKESGNDATKSNGTNESTIPKKLQEHQCWTDDDLIAQSFITVMAGHESTTSLLAFICYELAINGEIQQRLYEEIKEANDNLNGTRLSFDTLDQLKYFGQVVNETLRRWPPGMIGLRKCTKDIEINLNGSKVNIERGTGLWIPISAIHHDPKNFENPMQFLPDRFSDANKHKIKSGTFIPFGIGPRKCIASRFAIIASKAIIFQLLVQFTIQPYEKTQIPLRFAKTVMNWKVENGIHLEFVPR